MFNETTLWFKKISDKIFLIIANIKCNCEIIFLVTKKTTSIEPLNTYIKICKQCRPPYNFDIDHIWLYYTLHLIDNKIPLENLTKSKNTCTFVVVY